MSWYTDIFVETGRAPALWLIIAFVLTFAITRWVTRRLRKAELAAPEPAQADAPEEPVKSGLLSNIHLGGVHVHHQVWGILLVLIAGLLEFRYSPGSPWVEILAALFGAGAALALDEFALWLHLDDVYWSEEGRKSIDAVLVAGVIGVVMLMQADPLGLGLDGTESGWIVAFVLIVHFTYVIITFLKGKLLVGLVGVVVPFVSFVAAIRLAKPTSFWAHRFYSERKLERAHRRYSADALRRWNAFRDWIGGQPGPNLPASLDRMVHQEIERATVDQPASGARTATR